jgi:molybdate transport system substrate-binding protein
MTEGDFGTHGGGGCGKHDGWGLALGRRGRHKEVGGAMKAGLVHLLIAGAMIVGLAGREARAAEAVIAVAANFAEPARAIATEVTLSTGHIIVISSGSSAQLLTQIMQNAPFAAFLSADEDRPAQALERGFAVEGSRFTYAIGRIVLWTNDPRLEPDEASLREGRFSHLAIANPAAAPYGAAAIEAMTRLGLLDALKSRIVQGNSIAQTLQFVESGNAELGFVALSQVIGRADGRFWRVPRELYRPIRQDAVLLRQGENNDAARAFLGYLKSPRGQALVERYGYASAAE